MARRLDRHGNAERGRADDDLRVRRFEAPGQRAANVLPEPHPLVDHHQEGDGQGGIDGDDGQFVIAAGDLDAVMAWIDGR